jgi:hypothetical protein
MLLTRRPAELLEKNVICPSQGWRLPGILLRAFCYSHAIPTRPPPCGEPTVATRHRRQPFRKMYRIRPPPCSRTRAVAIPAGRSVGRRRSRHPHNSLAPVTERHQSSMPPADRGARGLWRPRTVAPADCGARGLWRPRTVAPAVARFSSGRQQRETFGYLLSESSRKVIKA